MKVKHLLVATLLLGSMTGFNACSSDEIDNVTPPVEQPAEELETVLAVSGAFGDKVSTRATNDDPEFTGEHLTSKDVINNYGVAIFAVDENNNPGKILAYYTEDTEWGTQDGFNNASQEGSKQVIDEYGYSLRPLKFKTSAKKIAMIVIANCAEVFKAEASFSTYADFEKKVNEVSLRLMPTFLDPDKNESEKPEKFNGYPMSSDIYLFDIVPGKYNTIGYGAGADGVNEIENSFDYYNVDNEFTEGNQNLVTDQRIDLYRCWSQVRLNSIAVKGYNSTEAKFVLKRVFMMNVPERTMLFNAENRRKAGEHKWGGELSFDYDTYVAESQIMFCSGWMYDSFQELKDPETSDNLKDTKYGDKFRTKNIADMSRFTNYYSRILEADAIELDPFTSSNPRQIDLKSDKYVPNTSFLDDANSDERQYLNFVVSADNYGLAKGQLKSNRAMALVVQGNYYEKVGGAWTEVTVDSDIEPVISGDAKFGEQEKWAAMKKDGGYYTVFVNKEGTASGGVLSGNIAGTIMRNVKYEIALTISGPGSDTPLGQLKSSYFVPKVTIVPFGKVSQEVEID